MASWRQQALIEAPVERVWALLEDPARFPQWNDSVRVTGVPTHIEKGSEFEIRGRGPLHLPTATTFRVEELEEMREIKLRCQTSGFYSRWLLTEAQGNTFAEVEMGVEPLSAGLAARAMSTIHTKGYLRRTADASLDGMRRELARRVEAAGPE